MLRAFQTRAGHATYIHPCRLGARHRVQTITELTFESSAGDLGVFSDLPLVTRSELIRSLHALS
jgi:hypothetical protein